MALELKTLTPTTVTIPKVGDVLLKKMSSTDLASLYDWHSALSEQERSSNLMWLHYQARMVIGCACNEDGSPQFSEEQVGVVANQEWLPEVYDQCVSLSKLTKEDEEAKKD